jgi:hypothetical protein
MSQEHLTAIRHLACALCHNDWAVDPHHMLSGPAARERGMGMKSTDRWALPVCRTHHDEIHRLGSRREIGFFLSFGIEPISLALALWNVSPDEARMARVLEAHKQQAICSWQETRKRIKAQWEGQR